MVFPIPYSKYKVSLGVSDLASDASSLAVCGCFCLAPFGALFLFCHKVVRLRAHNLIAHNRFFPKAGAHIFPALSKIFSARTIYGGLTSCSSGSFCVGW